MSKRNTLSEAHIQKACEDFLRLDGWRIFNIEQNYSERKRKVVAESGFPDCMAVRYQPNERHYTRADSHVLFVEWKSLKGKLKPAQLQWAAAERARGALVWLATVDFPPTIEGFQRHYRDSGLARNVR